MDLSSFHQSLPIKFKELVKFIYKNGFKTGVVGGVPRDFIITGNIGVDFDCELRPLDKEGINSWEDFISSLKENYNVEDLNYNIFRIQLDNIEVEVTLPRVENFDGTIGHSNFKAEHIADLDYSKGFKRRDFSINAIMFEFDGKNWELIDPLKGINDINNKILSPCFKTFSLDPVRFLRAFRFRTKLIFEFSEELNELLSTMDLSSLTAFYIKSELTKSNKPLIMLKRIMDFKSDFIDEFSILCDNKSLIDYDLYFNNNLETHLKQAIVLPVVSRELIIKKLGFSQKGILPNIKIDTNWKSLLDTSFESELFKQFYETISKLEQVEIAENKLDYILDFYAANFSKDNFMEFVNSKYVLSEIDKKEDAKNYKYIVFQKRLKAII